MCQPDQDYDTFQGESDRETDILWMQKAEKHYGQNEEADDKKCGEKSFPGHLRKGCYPCAKSKSEAVSEASADEGRRQENYDQKINVKRKIQRGIL